MGKCIGKEKCMKHKKVQGIVTGALSVGLALSMTTGPIVSMASGNASEVIANDISDSDEASSDTLLKTTNDEDVTEDAEKSDIASESSESQSAATNSSTDVTLDYDNDEDTENNESKDSEDNYDAKASDTASEASNASATDSSSDVASSESTSDTAEANSSQPELVDLDSFNAANDSTALNLQEAATNGNSELYVGSDWAWNNANKIEDETTTIINILRLGGNNGADAIWSLQYNLKNLNLTDNHSYTIDVDLTSTFDKNVTIKFDDSGLALETVQLKAGIPQHVTIKSNSGSFANKTMYFAIGQYVNNGITENPDSTGTLTIENVTIVDNTTGESVGFADDNDNNNDTNTNSNEYDFNNVLNDTNNAVDPGTIKNGYDLIWSDEFDGNYGDADVDNSTGLNLDNWAYQLGDGSTDCGNYGWGNNELQSYTERIDNIGVNEDLSGDGQADGLLRITAQYEQNGYNYADESTKKYTSARIRSTKGTEALFNTTYGYIESRISVPGTKGAWPAFWMLPESTDIYGGWPVSGEIDILETVGSFGDNTNNKACGTLHWGAPEHVYKGSGYVTLDSDTTYFHTYAIDWEPGKISWIYDGEVINTLENWEGMINGTTSSLSYDAPFDQPFYMLLNLAVDSGQFGGSNNKASFTDDINMYVDYVRVYQKSDGYPDSVTRNIDENTGSDWADYSGINQIADISASNLTTATDGNMNSLESGSSMDSSKWYLAYQSDAKDAAINSFTKDGTDYAKITVNTPGSQDYSVQLIGHYNAQAGYVYKVSFDAFADGSLVGKNVNCDSKEWKGWSTYGIQSFTLSSKPEHYSYYINQTEDFDNCRIEFNLGSKASGNAYIGNVKVEIVDPALMLQDEETRHPSANGDVIYNGTFDQGNNRTGYWHAADGTTLTVPRYTKSKVTDNDLNVVDVASSLNKFENISNGIKYYERRAQIIAQEEKESAVYQSGLTLPKGHYTLTFDMYSDTSSAVDASICKSKGTNINEEIVAANAEYDNGLKTYTWNFDLLEDLDESSLVLKFPAGSKVQIDNVSLIGDSLGASIDTNPITASDLWTAHDGFSGALNVNRSGDVNSLSNVISGGSWYSPQIISKDFTLTGGINYEISFKYKMEGTTNNTFEYIVQENGGGWHVFKDITKVNYENTTDNDGYNEYKATFTANTTLNPVHIVIGLGNSAVSGNNIFSFKDFSLTAIAGSANDDTSTNANELVNRDTANNSDDEPSTDNPETPDTPQPDNSDAPADNAGDSSSAPATSDPINKDNPEVASSLEVGTKFKTSGGTTYIVTAENEVSYVKPKNKKVKSVSIPATVTKDGVTYKVTAVSAKAFKGYKKLTKVVIGSNVTTIGSKAFYKCRKLSTIKISSKKITSFGNKTFKGISSKAIIKVKKKVYKNYKEMIKEAGAKSVTIKK